MIYLQVTVDYISKCVASGLYDGSSFYRSDFVIQVERCCDCFSHPNR